MPFQTVDTVVVIVVHAPDRSDLIPSNALETVVVIDVQIPEKKATIPFQILLIAPVISSKLMPSAPSLSYIPSTNSEKIRLTTFQIRVTFSRNSSFVCHK